MMEVDVFEQHFCFLRFLGIIICLFCVVLAMPSHYPLLVVHMRASSSCLCEDVSYLADACRPFYYASAVFFLQNGTSWETEEILPLFFAALRGKTNWTKQHKEDVCAKV